MADEIYVNRKEVVMQVCRNLSDDTGKFSVGCRHLGNKAGGIHTDRARKYLRELIADGRIVLVEPASAFGGSGCKSAVYRVVKHPYPPVK